MLGWLRPEMVREWLGFSILRHVAVVVCVDETMPAIDAQVMSLTIADGQAIFDFGLVVPDEYALM